MSRTRAAKAPVRVDMFNPLEPSTDLLQHGVAEAARCAVRQEDR